MKVKFSIDLHDKDGDAYEYGIYLHLNDAFMVRFANIRELADFQITLAAMMKEIKENYAIPGLESGAEAGNEGGR